MKKEVYNVGGMSCAACSSGIERVTRKIEGVKRSDANLTTGKLVIFYDDEIASSQQIIDSVKKLGFEIQLDEKYRNETTQNKGVNLKKIAKKREDEDNEELLNKKHNLIGAVIFSIILMYISMGHIIGIPLIDIINQNTHPQNWVLIQILMTIPILYFGRSFFKNGYNALFHLNPNMDSLVAISVTASFLFSLGMAFLVSDNPLVINNMYFDAGATILTLVSLGKYLEGNSKQKTKSAIKKLMELSPETAFLVKDLKTLKTENVEIETIKKGDILMVKPGGKVPLDGVIVSGSSWIDESMLTGESIPIEKNKNDKVIGGSINKDGTLVIEVKKIGEDTTLAKIVKFIEDAQGKKAPISKVADKVSGVFVPIVMSIAILAAIVWIILGKDIGFSVKVFTSVLVIACPCALGLATPTSIMVGTGLGAKNGILVRSGEALESIHKANVVVFDKTGTITKGVPVVTEVYSESMKKEDIIYLAGTVENASQHPLGKAIVDKMNEVIENKSEISISTVENFIGKGISATLEDKRVISIGNDKLMDALNININSYKQKINEFASKGQTPMCFAINNNMEGLICVSDTVKESSKIAIEKLQKKGMEVIMITGDNVLTAKNIADQVGIKNIEAEILPENKAKIIEKYQKDNNNVIMVGDGINDAPALVQADIGIAIGNGSDVAIESADVVLMKNDLMDVYKTVNLSKFTIKNIKENLFWAFCYNVLGIPVAAGVLYPFTGMLLSPIIASFAMSLSSVCVVSNALRLRTKKIG